MPRTTPLGSTSPQTVPTSAVCAHYQFALAVGTRIAVVVRQHVHRNRLNLDSPFWATKSFPCGVLARGGREWPSRFVCERVASFRLFGLARTNQYTHRTATRIIAYAACTRVDNSRTPLITDDSYTKSICPPGGPWPRASPRATKPSRGSPIQLTS